METGHIRSSTSQIIFRYLIVMVGSKVILAIPFIHLDMTQFTRRFSINVLESSLFGLQLIVDTSYL